MRGVLFPRVVARDLGGRAAELPGDLPAERNVVIVAFRRQQQALVDSWVPWLSERAASDPRMQFVEMPAIGRQWAPVRPMIDRGMAASAYDDAARRRTLTVYTDVRRITGSLGIDRLDTIWLFLVHRDGRVAWRGSGAFDSSAAAALDEALAVTTGATPQGTTPGGTGEASSDVEQFEMAFDPRVRMPLALMGITPLTAHVTLAPDRLIACFGPWICRTVPGNVRAVSVTGPYRWYRAVGPRLSLADRGLTFGSTPAGGACMLFREPVRGIDPRGRVRHPGLTLTVAEPERFAVAVRRVAGLPGDGS